jgi:DNA-binding GntR family transcriptional regulator
MKQHRKFDRPADADASRPLPGAKKDPAPVRSRGAAVRTIYEALKRDILELAIAPGDPLDEARLSERFSTSRTPVREALVRLAAEGLITTLPNRNTVVTAIDLANIPVYFDALCLMYRVTTRLAALHRTKADLVEIRKLQGAFARAVAAADVLGMIGTNRDFHLAIARAGRNKYFTEMSARLLDEGRRVLRIYYSTFNDHLPREFVHEHEAIIDAIAAADADLADRLASDHAAQIIGQIQEFIAHGIGRGLILGAHAPRAPMTRRGGARSSRQPGTGVRVGRH